MLDCFIRPFEYLGNDSEYLLLLFCNIINSGLYSECLKQVVTLQISQKHSKYLHVLIECCSLLCWHNVVSGAILDKISLPKILPFEPCHEIMVLFVLRKLILQKQMRSHPVGLDVLFVVGPFVYFHTQCVRTVKALARLRKCVGSPEPLLVACMIWFL